MNAMECGCKTNGFMIEYCPKHKAAPDMYEALKEIWAMTATKCHNSYIKSINDLCGKALTKAEA